MKNPIQLLYSHITIAKFICLALLFSPLWGFWWFNINSQDELGSPGFEIVLYYT